MNLANIFIFIQLLGAHADVIFRRLTKNQSLELSCSPQQDLGRLMGLHLYHRSSQSQTTLLSIAGDGEHRVNPEHRGRLQLCGRLDSPQVNVTISHLEHSDTGLYMWELSYGEELSPDLVLSAQKVFLLVDGAAAGLVMLTLGWLAAEKCVKARRHHRPQPPVPIYEEMTRKQQSAGIPQNNHEAPSHLEEDNFPVYANPNIRQPQDNYYACPRQLALRA
ncbi:uncharacterized protein LOC111645866 isoform X2 [Seriola lalandi dorsalis]|uniref:uncharacterized protein LOC111645866 isoform X2 n=1 Tax=Seriola lalandi dorsalis TaxID=1841481 RepID=UPI000C6FB8F7|nr:uncharacterized protein LOC111645866 isoform X2 [Seriola lalandi dorsalis]XP_056256597.1 uncharacterized protein LOC130184631 isoform X2 [Seriola aureovittata]